MDQRHIAGPSGPPTPLPIPIVAIRTPDDHTAVLFFSLRPEREGQNKQFVRRDLKKHRGVAEALYRHALNAARSSGYPVLEMTGARQRGVGFGPRFANAVADAFAQGYERVIAVGSDCPRLHEVDWHDVGARLADGTPVIGPTADREGAYLIGLTREQFDREAFEALPWTTAGLFPALRRHLTHRAGAPPVCLAPRDDINGHADLVSLLRRRAALPPGLRRRLRHVLGARVRVAESCRPRVRRGGRPRRTRGPPTGPRRRG